MDAIANRLQEYLKHKNMTAKEFEYITGLGNGTCARITDKTRKTTFDRISKSKIDLNINWLLTGEGEMLRGGVRQTSHGDNSPNINGDNNHLGTEFTPEAALKEIEAQRKLTERAMALLEKKDEQLEKKDEQISHLLSLLHK